MLVRIVLFIGVGLVLAAFGAAGWQYWQSLPARVATVAVEVIEEAPAEDTAEEEETADAPEVAEAAPDDEVAEPGQAWLISDTGGLVALRDARAFLSQGKFYKDRRVRLQVRLPLSSLLSQGEALPAEVYLEAFAEVRAGVAGAKLCAPILATWAQGCVLSDAGLVKKSYDAASQTAEFRVTALFTLKPEADPLPDLATRAFSQDHLSDRDLPAIAQRATPEDYLAGVAASIAAHCAAVQAEGSACRVLSVGVAWESPAENGFNVSFGTLGPLPKGMYTAPPLF